MGKVHTGPWLATLLAAGALSGAGPAKADLDTALYGELLHEYTEEVSSAVGTRVNYAGLGRDARWKTLVASLEAATPPPPAARTERLAFWINAYNVLAIQTIVEHYPVESIRDVGSFFSPVWKRVAAHIDGKPVTLDQIEHAILRKMGEPRIHAAIVCASTSCPSLAREPFAAATLDAQLDATTQRWLDDPNKGMRVDRASQRVHLSSIFNWFSDDFEARGGALAFASRYASAENRAWITASEPSLSFFDYDWSLNDWPSGR